jgi:hypothetical protein
MFLMSEPNTFYGYAMQGHADGSPREPDSLQQKSQLWSSRANAASATPISVEQQIQLSPQNGRSEEAAGRVLPGGGMSIPATNGSSPEASEAMRDLQLIRARPLNGPLSI